MDFLDFHSANFLFFLLLLLLLFIFLKKGRLLLLAAANVVFYGYSGLGVLALFFLVTLATYIIVRLMADKGWRRLVWLGVGINLLNLGYFKYTYFVTQSAESVYRSLFRQTVEQSQQWFGWVPEEIILPIGISFYTFQLISYVIDVYRGDTKPTSSFIKFWVYISLFPQLVAGPIMRGNELLPQLDHLDQHRMRWSEVKLGVYFIVIGLIKKVMLADPIAGFVNPLFAQGDAIDGIQSWWAAYAFGFQIYFDFSAYSDMAMGIALLFGIRLILNFNSPYVSADPSEFWRRWHISLSRWIRDYVYIGLGGNRKGKSRTLINLLLAMVLSGLWHGAMWTFVLWGALHGVLLILHKWSLALNRWKWLERMRSLSVWRIVSIAVFFHITTWTWVFFRAESIDQAFFMTREMISVNWLQLLTSGPMLWIALLYLLHVIEYGIRQHEQRASMLWHRVPFPLRGVVYLVWMLAMFYFLKGESYEFIYFQF